MKVSDKARVGGEEKKKKRIWDEKKKKKKAVKDNPVVCVLCIATCQPQAF